MGGYSACATKNVQMDAAILGDISIYGLLFRRSAGVTRKGQQQFATQTLRVHLLGIDEGIAILEVLWKRELLSLGCPSFASDLKSNPLAI